jgi:uncharacterized protein
LIEPRKTLREKHEKLTAMALSAQAFVDQSVDPPVCGYLHQPAMSNGDAIVLTHGAGGNSRAPLLVALGDVFAEHGFSVLRCDLSFRQQRRFGPPSPAHAERDRAGLRNAVILLRKNSAGRLFLGGHSYGGRQATMLCADEPDLVSGLLLLSYPLHPPGKPEQLRTQHLPSLRTASLFVHGAKDPFGSIEEMRVALRLIAARTDLMTVEDAGHDLGFKPSKSKSTADSSRLPNAIAQKFIAISCST